MPPSSRWCWPLECSRSSRPIGGVHDNLHQAIGDPLRPLSRSAPEHPLCYWLRGPEKYPSKTNNITERRGCRSLGVGAIQAMMRAHLQQADLSRLLNPETQSVRPTRRIRCGIRPRRLV